LQDKAPAENVTMSAMFGKKVKEYLRFERWILILIVVVFALRLGLSWLVYSTRAAT
jgi:hypothetical protein